MTIILDENFIAMWYYQLEEGLDFLSGLVAKRELSPSPPPINLNEKQELTYTYRFRYYKDDMVFHSEDEKHWYEITILDHTPQETIEKLRGMISIMFPGKKVTEILIDERGQAGVFECMKQLPMFHMQQVKESQA